MCVCVCVCHQRVTCAYPLTTVSLLRICSKKDGTVCKIEAASGVFFLLFFKIIYLFTYLVIFRERERREKVRERNIEMRGKHWSVASSMSPTADLACNPDMCSDWKSNQQPFGPQASAQSTELHQPGPAKGFNREL